MLQRLRTDFRLSIITLLGACAVFWVAPFAVFRFATGDTLVGVIDTLLVACVLGAILHAWRRGDSERASLFVVFCITIASVTVASLIGTLGLFWLYVAFVANFCLIRPRWAALISAIGMVAVVLQGSAFASLQETIFFLATAIVVCVIVFIFANRAEAYQERLTELATRDPLTGVGNRRALEEELQIAVANHRRSGTPYGALMLDLDRFKRVNDRHGHEVGDKVLIAFADIVGHSIRRGDRLFRFGGEEFVALLPDTAAEGVATVAENVRLRVEAGLRCPSGVVTTSVGGAVLGAEERWEDWLARADAALYRAKQGGRNRVELAAAPPVAAAPRPAQPA